MWRSLCGGVREQPYVVFAGSDAGSPISLNERDASHIFGSTGRKFHFSCRDELCCVIIGPFRHFSPVMWILFGRMLLFFALPRRLNHKVYSKLPENLLLVVLICSFLWLD
jgi:hypothetical protein